MADSELLLSCGKDAKILCSNPNTGEVLYAHHLKKTSVQRWHSGICKAGVGVLAFLGVMLLWAVSLYPVYLCLV